VGTAHAQQTGTIQGQVVNAVTGNPIERAEVFIEGTALTTFTRADGRYELAGVPAGPQTVRARVLGFSSTTVDVTILAGEATRARFDLREEIFSLDAVVITGLPTAGRRRELGSSLNQIQMRDVEVQPVQSLETLLQASGPGIQSFINQGQVGASGRLQLRGVTSVSQGNEPLVYIDGIRMSTERTPAAAAFDGRNTRVSGFAWNDINPADIDRVEVIKGAAATSLYGTEASGGVIQIFTKRGTSGRAQWQFSITQGANFWPQPSSVIQEHPTSLDIDVIKKTGHVQSFSGSVRGGTPDLDYFFSASGSDENGIIDTQWSKHWTVNGNFGLNLFEGMSVRLTNTFTHRRTRQVPDGNNRYGYMLNVLRVGRGYWPDNRDQSWVLEQEYYNDLDTFLGGANLEYHHGDFSHNFRVGLHHMESANSGYQPYGWYLNPLGTISQRRFQNRLITAEYAGSYERDLSSAIRSTFSVGGQLYDERQLDVRANGQDFPGPGEHTVTSAARTDGYESKIREVNAGFFAQEMIGIQDRLFLTAGIRLDGSSTFGEDYSFQVYPKFSASYVLSDMEAWPVWWNTLRLRGAVGMAGKAPGAFDAARTWNPISARDGQPGLTPRNVGNPDLGPEKTLEFEGGFDADMFDARLNVEFTYYDAKTTDALFEVRPIPSEGWLNTQLENVGELRSRGVELSMNGVLVDMSSFNWAVGTSVTTTKSEIVDMGGAAPFGVGRNQEIREGYAPPSFFVETVKNPDEFADPIFSDTLEYVGNTFPSTTVNFTTDISAGPFTLSALGELVDGGNIVNAVGYLNTIRTVWPGCTRAQELDDAGQTDQLTALERAKCLRRFNSDDMWIEDADYFKLRNVSLTFRFPDNLLPRGVSSASLSVSGLNLLKVTDYTGIDPESHQGSGTGGNFWREDYYSVPPKRSFLMKLNLTF
jgi:TonB-dependent SusC/RagA subfamily outer membrane receptor